MSTEINPLTSNLLQLLNTKPISTAVEGFSDQDAGSFANILTEAFGTTNVTDAIDKTNSTNLITGVEDDLSGMLLDMQKAEIALQLTLQIRNKIMDAYNEVMRMSV